MSGEKRSITNREERLRLEKALRESVILRELGELLNSSLDLEHILKELVKRTTELCDVERCAVWLLEDARGGFVPTTYHISAQNIAPHTIQAADILWFRDFLPLDNPIMQRLLKDDEPLFLEDLRAEPTLMELANTYSVRSALLIALKREERPVGILTLDNPGRYVVFSRDQQQLARAIGQQATIAIENARLFARVQDEQRRAEQLIERARAIYQVALSVNSGKDLSVVLELALQHLVRGLAATNGIITVLDAEGQNLYLGNGSHGTRSLYTDDTPVGRLEDFPNYQYAARTGQPLFVTQEQAESAEIVWFRKFGLENALIIPLVIGDLSQEHSSLEQTREPQTEQLVTLSPPVKRQCVGLAFVNFERFRQPTRGQFAFAQDIAAQCALAIEKANLLAEAHRAAELANERAQTLDAVFQAMTEGLTVVTADGEVLIRNNAAAQFLGVPVHSTAQLKTFLHQFPTYTLHGHPMSDEEFPLSRALHGEYIRGERFITTRGDGAERVVEVNATPLLDSEGKQTGLVSAFRDITEQARAEHRIRHALETLLHIAEAVSGITEIKDILRSVLERTLVTLNCARGLVQLYDAEDQNFSPLLSIGFTPEQEREWLAEQRLWLDPLDGKKYGFRKQILSGYATLINTEQCLQQPNPFGHLMVLAAPITHQRKLLGLILLDRSAPPPSEVEDAQPLVDFTIWDIAVVEGIAQLAGLAIEQARWQQEARVARDSEAAMREANALKDEFMAITAHEFRTPLTVILAHSQVALRSLRRTSDLLDASQEPAASSHLEDNLTTIEEQTRQLNNIVTTFLDVSRINRGQLTIKSDLVDLGAIAQQVVTSHAAVSEAHSISCEIAPSGKPYLVKGDGARLEQIIANLVENAIKYSPFGGPVKVCVRRCEQKTGVEIIEVRVEDEGIGVPPEAQPRLFERFYRASNIEGGKARGIGLGLYIVAQLLHMHGGEIHVESSGILGEGSHFVFTLPAPKVEIKEEPTTPHALVQNND